MGKWDSASSTRDETLIDVIESTSFSIRNIFDSVRFATESKNSVPASKSFPAGK